jgi:UTP--glucose-1-phosphate uridylyltransferase
MGISLAIIAAAGRGTRFLPCTKTVPKELLPLFDRPVIHHLVEEVAAAEIPEVLIVTRPGNRLALQEYFSRDPELDRYLANGTAASLVQPLYELLDRVRISFVQQPSDLPYGSASPLLAARHRLAVPFVYLYGDDVILEQTPGTSLRSLVSRFERTDAKAVVGAYRVPRHTISQVGSIAYCRGTDCTVEHIIEKPSIEKAPSVTTPIGRQVVSPAILPVLDRMLHTLATGQELQMTDALSALAQQELVLAPLVEGRWLTAGDPQNLLRASQAVSKSRLPE